MQVRLAPQGLIGHVVLVLMGAILLELLASAVIFELADIHGARTMRAGALADKLTVVTRVMESTPGGSRAAVADGLSTPKTEVRWLPEGDPVQNTDDRATRLARELQQREPMLAGRDVRVVGVDDGAGGFGESHIAAAVRLGDGSWVQVASHLRAQSYGALWAAGGSAVILSVAITLIAIIVLRSMGSPLRALARAAESVGQGVAVHVPEEGAGDLRRVAHAFNQMQARINDLLRERTEALAAAGHDLRTPLSRIRLRAGLVADARTRRALEDDVDEMISMLDSLLAYFGGRHEAEQRRPVDLAALCMTLVDAASDAGSEASYDGPERLVACVPSSSVRRAVDNLIQNALLYGDRAEVSLKLEGDHVVIRVEDDGPGIPEDQLTRVREPFVRLDNARARNTRGMGLGIPIVQRVADHEAGELILANRAPKGLRVELRLPHREAVSPQS
jgi:signal transduction histidine kinase